MLSHCALPFILVVISYVSLSVLPLILNNVLCSGSLYNVYIIVFMFAIRTRCLLSSEPALLFPHFLCSY